MGLVDERDSRYTFEHLNRDLDEIYELLRREKYNKHDIKQLMSPILSKIPQERRKTSDVVAKAILIACCISATLYALTYWDTFYWTLSAVTRILMIKILPFFDWRYLKNERCLVGNVFHRREDLEVFNCDVCESRLDFDRLTYKSDRNVEEVIARFVDLDRPVIVDGGLDHWIKNSSEEFLSRLVNEREFRESFPCQLRTDVLNTRRGDVDVETLFRKAELLDVFFLHFQNCEPDAVRIFRKYTYRPGELPAELSPVTRNWLVWNKSYKSTKYRTIELVEKYALIGQMFGRTRLRLVPRKNCRGSCPASEGVLERGQFLVVTSLWDVEYLPGGEGENVAAILEIKG